jgi:hypothetical protein
MDLQAANLAGNNMKFLFAMAGIEVLGHSGVLISLPLILSACILICARRLPQTVKRFSAAIDLAAFGSLLWMFSIFRVHSHRNPFN